MALEIIGAGFGRTGTSSLKQALEMLGFAPCHHMSTVVASETERQYWERIAEGEDLPWDQVFDGYRAQVDWPGARFWRELAEHYPAAKVILSVRDADSWHKSVTETIGRYMVAEPDHPTESQNRSARMGYKLINQPIFGAWVHDADHAKAVFDAHNAEVQATIPPDRLLVLPVGAGWGPLCDFLGVNEPDTPYPSKNSTSEFRARGV